MDDQSADVVVAGAINTDLVAIVDRAPGAGETVTGRSFHVFSGGKGANQAVAARRSGASVALAGAIGDDAFGADRMSDLRADGIDISDVRKLNGMASGVALITVERQGENRIAYVPGPTLKISAEQVVRAIERARPPVYLQPNEIPGTASIAALRAAKLQGAVTILNAAPDPESVRELLPFVDHLVVNEIEAATLLGRTLGFESMVTELAADTGVGVVLTAGADGVYSARDGTCVHLSTPRVTVVDTTGAGDTFCGAFAARIAAGVGIEPALRWAVSAASLATTRPGAQPAIPTSDEIDAFIGGK